MKNTILTILGALVMPLAAATPTAEFAPELRPLFETLISERSLSLVGKEYTVPLRIKHASEKFLVFSNSQIQLDPDTKYEIGKWRFDTSITSPYHGKKNVVVFVKFRIDQIHKEDPKMPFFEATILSISEPNEDKNEPNQ
ncbi:MAG: hypothetical protein FJ392_13065 [Verrucomicrobia bacterium]|nr:hypothetical protein [Verrucomicrobiota bacterium]